MDRGEYWILIMGSISLVTPMALVEHVSIFLEDFDTWIVLPWCYYSIRSNLLGIHNVGQYPHFNGLAIWSLGIAWTLIGLILGLIIYRNSRNSRRLFALIACLSIVVLQSLTVVMVFILAAKPLVFITIIPFPIPSILALIIVIQHNKTQHPLDSVKGDAF